MAQTEGLTKLREITDALINRIDKVTEIAPADELPEMMKGQVIGTMPEYLQKARTVFLECQREFQTMMIQHSMGLLKFDRESVEKQETIRYNWGIMKALFWLAFEREYNFSGEGYMIGKNFEVAQFTREQAQKLGSGEDIFGQDGKQEVKNEKKEWVN